MTIKVQCEPKKFPFGPIKYEEQQVSDWNIVMDAKSSVTRSITWDPVGDKGPSHGSNNFKKVLKVCCYQVLQSIKNSGINFKHHYFWLPVETQEKLQNF